MSHGRSRFGRGRGVGVVWPFLLVVGLVLFIGVDYDGDPSTDNGPVVALTVGIDGCYREEDEAELSLPCEPAPSLAGKRLWRWPRRWQRRVRSAWYRGVRPIRGP